VILQRVIAYIDGFNLYFGLRDRGLKPYYWLDLVGLIRSLLKPDQKLEAVHYFTARIRATPGNRADAKRQTTYLDALHTRDSLEIHYGHYLYKNLRCYSCGSQWEAHEEKMTDVNIATRMLVDAYENQFDTALLVSADSDLVTPVREICSRFPDKRIVAAMPPNRASKNLRQAAHASFQIGEANIRKNQFPEEIPTPSGYVLRRPETWK
jgi:uncharacterized LabA/DUF88 family protein